MSNKTKRGIQASSVVVNTNSVIKTIMVRYRRDPETHHVTYMSRRQAELFLTGKTLRIISIVDKGEAFPDFGKHAKVLQLEHDGWVGFTGEQVNQIHEFAKAADGANIHVHCEMGLIRSKWVAERIGQWLGYRVMTYRDLHERRTDHAIIYHEL
jgi:predicted protein tyrosine phosphatase